MTQNPAPKRHRKWPWILLSIVVVIIGLAVINSPSPSTSSPTGPNPVAAAPTTTAPNTIGQGTYRVPADIKPGTYRTDGPTPSTLPNCYWSRLRDTSGQFSAIIANGNTPGPVTITIAPDDVAFETRGCKPWALVG